MIFVFLGLACDNLYFYPFCCQCQEFILFYDRVIFHHIYIAHVLLLVVVVLVLRVCVSTWILSFILSLETV